jgi:hypothetical protein
MLSSSSVVLHFLHCVFGRAALLPMSRDAASDVPHRPFERCLGPHALRALDTNPQEVADGRAAS